MHVISPLYLIKIPVNMLLRVQYRNIGFILSYLLALWFALPICVTDSGAELYF